MDPLELLRSHNRYEETLPSGLEVTLRMPRLRDCILAGKVPVPVLMQLVEASTSNGDAPEVSDDTAVQMARFQDEIVRRSIVAIQGEPVELTVEDLADIRQDDYDAIVAFATRESPKVAAP